ncbi:MAG: TetR/AcrR family transcriptional regulator [Rhodococcus sp. (in: high G+C Gram-positive bacteria)]|nr:MAG: TetR/AcrR family transcriptional regulator [Rhodococcus sp. (in: high G+C Gram-positive bacteria)]
MCRWSAEKGYSMPSSKDVPSSNGAGEMGNPSTARDRNGKGPRTRGGWTPAGTAAKRRETHSRQGTARGQRRRREILDAARRVFERDGYIDVNVEDIVQEANVSRGSFYTYFPSKLDAFQALTSEMGDQIDQAVTYRADPAHVSPVDDLREANRRYIEVYRENAAFYGLVEQVSTMDAETGSFRQIGRKRHIDRVARRIRAWQKQGYADPAIHPTSTAAALVSMTSNQCYWWFVGGEKSGHPDRDDEVLNDIWVRVLGLRDEPCGEWMKSA